jgi:hypothetical protein
VGLATPAFAVPSVPEVSGVGNGPTTEQLNGASKGFTKSTDAMSALPGLFQFAPSSADESTPVDAAPAASSTSTEASPESSAESSPESSPASSEQVPAEAPGGVLPSIPGSPVGAQTNPQVSGPTDGTMQTLDAAGLF